MNTVHLFTAALALVICPAALALPGGYRLQLLEGRVVKIEKLPAPLRGKDCVVVHLLDATGIERKPANGLFRAIRHTGYEPARRTLKKTEIVVVLPEAKAKDLQIGQHVRIVGYKAWIGEGERHIFEVEVEKLEKIPKPPK